MTVPFIGSEALARGDLTPYVLRSRYGAVYPDVYLPRGFEITAVTRAHAAWLWSRRRGVVAGRSAAALHGARWVDPGLPAEVLSGNRRPPAGITVWSDAVCDEELATIDGIAVTTPARTALDLACRYRLDKAVAAIDALARATRLKPADIDAVLRRHGGRRSVRQARHAIALFDAGAESPRETWLRLLLMRNGFPRPATQIPVRDEYGVVIAYLDMGWEDVKIAAEYDGDHHRTSRSQFVKDIRRAENIQNAGWIHVRVTAADTEGEILRRLRSAFARRA